MDEKEVIEFLYDLLNTTDHNVKHKEAVQFAENAIKIVQKLPDIIKILENYKDPNPQNLYGMQKNVHYNDAIILLNDLIS